MPTLEQAKFLIIARCSYTLIVIPYECYTINTVNCKNKLKYDLIQLLDFCFYDYCCSIDVLSTTDVLYEFASSKLQNKLMFVYNATK